FAFRSKGSRLREISRSQTAGDRGVLSAIGSDTGSAQHDDKPAEGMVAHTTVRGLSGRRSLRCYPPRGLAKHRTSLGIQMARLIAETTINRQHLQGEV